MPESRRPCFSATLIGLRGWSQDLDLAGNVPPAPVRTNSESCVGSNPTVDIFFFACHQKPADAGAKRARSAFSAPRADFPPRSGRIARRPQSAPIRRKPPRNRNESADPSGTATPNPTHVLVSNIKLSSHCTLRGNEFS